MQIFIVLNDVSAFVYMSCNPNRSQPHKANMHSPSNIINIPIKTIFVSISTSQTTDLGFLLFPLYIYALANESMTHINHLWITNAQNINNQKQLFIINFPQLNITDSAILFTGLIMNDSVRFVEQQQQKRCVPIAECCLWKKIKVLTIILRQSRRRISN